MIPSEPAGGARRILITGGSGDIGGAVVKLLREDGDHAVLLGHSAHSHADVVADFGDDNALKAAVESIPGVLSGAVLSHGITERGTLESVEPGAWRRVLDVNLNSVFAILAALGPRLDGVKSIVVISSTAGLDRSRNGGPHYTASKAAVNGLVRHLAAELGPRGIRINAVCPGHIEGRMSASLNTAATEAAGVAGIPLRRAGRPDEVAEVVRFLLSERASYVTGALVPVAGGTHR